MFCALLVHHSLSCRLFSRDVTTWLFRLSWTLFPELFPIGYFVSSGDYYDLTGTQKITTILLELKRSKSKCFVLSLCTAVSLVDSVSRDVSNWLFRLSWALFPGMFPTGYFVSSGDYHDLTGTQKITTILLELQKIE